MFVVFIMVYHFHHNRQSLSAVAIFYMKMKVSQTFELARIFLRLPLARITLTLTRKYTIEKNYPAKNAY